VREFVNGLVGGLLTPTVLTTAALCAAIDYANQVAKEDRLIPASVESSLSQGAQFLYENSDQATAFGTAATVAALAAGSPVLATAGALTTAVAAGFAWEKSDKSVV
jgi:hypothetical protein